MIERAGTGERVYLAIKTYLLTESAHRPGDRIEVADLSRRVGASATPVRAALHRMAGERLLVSHQGEGFSMPRSQSPASTDLYQWNAALLVNALNGRAERGPRRHAVPAIPGSAPILALEDLFAGWRRALRQYRGRVGRGRRQRSAASRPPRRTRIGPGVQRRGRWSWRGWRAGDVGAVRQAIIAYHRKRLRLVSGDHASPARPG
jgi:hypothetical protein